MLANAPFTFEYIDTPVALSVLVEQLESIDQVAVDLEADSLYHFNEKVCLIQIATESQTFVIDPLVLKDLSPLKPLFENKAIQKIFHGADYDVRSLDRDFGFVINNLFDTELAARFLGVSGTGLESVVRQYFNIDLDKKYQKKDWSKRPLPDPMIDYAARDVMYLLPMAEYLTAELAGKNRLSWVREECANLSRVRIVQDDRQPLYLKFKGAGRLAPRALAVLDKVLTFRRQAAQKKDKPLFKIFSNRAALAIAVEQPTTLQALRATNTMGNTQMGMYGEKIIDCVKRALSMAPSTLPVYPKNRTPRLPSNVPPRVKALQRWRQDRADELQIDAGLLCNRALVTQLAIQNPTTRAALAQVEDMKGWQREAFGDEILSVLQTVQPKRTPRKKETTWKKK